MNTTRIYVLKKISLLNCVIGLTILNPMPILATAPNLSVPTNSSVGSMWGGIQRVGFNYSCLARMTRERIKELQND